MSNRIQNSYRSFSKALRVSATVLAATVVLSGCSNFTRFDFPIFGLDDDDDQPAVSVPARTEGVNRVYPPLSKEERRKSGDYYSSIYSSERENERSSRAEQDNDDYERPSRRSESYQENRYESRRDEDDYVPPRLNSSRSSSYSNEDSEPSSYNSRRSASYSDNSSYGAVDTRTTGSLVVRRGDTLYSLARNNNVSLNALKRANGLRNNTIHVGQELVLPGSQKRNTTYRPKRYASYQAPKRYSSDRYDDYEPRTTKKVKRKRRQYDSDYSSDYRKRQEFKRTRRKTERKLEERKRRRTVKEKKPPRKRYKPKQHSVVRAPEIVNERRDTENRARRIEQEQRKREERAAELRRKREEARRRAESERREKAERAEKEKVRVASRTENRRAQQDVITMPKTSGRFRWPVRGRIISKFGAKRNGARNDGINLSVPYGTDVKAAENGVVAYAGNELKGYGNLVLIRHRNKWVSAYAHNSRILVRRGQRIRRGQVIAKAGKSGSVSQPQVHFELRRDAKPVDPLKYM